MILYNFRQIFLPLIIITFGVGALMSQEVTRVYGKITDAATGEALAFVDVGFVGTFVGTNTDDNGEFTLESRFGSDSLYFNYVGYKSQTIKIKNGQRQLLNIALKSDSYTVKDVVVVEKKQKYRKKDNPAIDLSRKIVDNRNKNHIKSLPFHSYKQHEKIKVDLNNITEGFQNNIAFRKFDYVWDYMDTSEVNGRTYLPLFLKETLSKINYRNSDNTTRETIEATRYTEFNKDLDAGTIGSVMDAMYQDVDVYSEDLSIMEMQFVSPLSSSGPNYYRYYIIDTLEYKGRSVINLSFLPAVKGNRGFTGSMYVTNDDRFSVLKIDMGIIKNINLNFIRDLRVIQEFEPILDTLYIKTKDEIVIDYSVSDNGVGFFGTRSLSYDNFQFDPPVDQSIFNGVNRQIYSDSMLLRSDDYWHDESVDSLDQGEKEVYEMVGKLVNDPIYKVYVYFSKGAATGYLPAGPWEFGPLGTFYSFNAVDGRNLRLGGRSTYDFAKKWAIKGNVAHASLTNIWKYTGSLTYTFNDEWKTNPRHFVRVAAERNATFPGQELDFFNPDNFLLSFRRGRATDMLLENTYEANYTKESRGFNFSIGAKHKSREPYGTMKFNALRNGEEVALSAINSTEILANFRYAPNEQFIQGKEYRTQLQNEYPIIELRLTQGVGGLVDNDYTFTRAYLNISKQVEWTRIGTTDIVVEGGKTWGEVPYLLQFVPRGNQTYANFKRSYNLMNFLEFSNDQFVAVNVEHFMYGYILNAIPLVKRLQLREVFGVKALYGSLSDKNNPNLNKDQVQFVRDENNIPTTYVMNGVPYIEASVGLTNIFKVFRVDFIKRFTYLDNPRLPTLFGRNGMGLRANFAIEF